jgi:hypothetical protein
MKKHITWQMLSSQRELIFFEGDAIKSGLESGIEEDP